MIRIVIIGLILLFIALPSCVTSIKKINKNPQKYNNKSVKIEGKVINSLELEGFRGFWVKDKTGKIAVLTESFLPVHGDKIKIKGKVKTNFTFQRVTMTVIVEKVKKNKDSLTYNNILYK
jgi:hypothetical protein